MKKRTKALISIVEEMGYDIQGYKNSFKLRNKISKTIYLAQIFGLDLGYRFSWYVVGPNCSTITNDIYRYLRHTQKFNSNVEDVELTDKTLKILQKVKNLITGHHYYGFIDSVSWSEALSKVHYLKHIAAKPKSKTKKSVINAILNNAQYDYTEKQLESAWEALKEYNLISEVEKVV